MMSLSNGRIVQQDVSPLDLCNETHIDNLQIAVARKFNDGEGILSVYHF